MTYQTTVLPNGVIDATPLPKLRPGTKVEITVPESDDSFEAFLRRMEEIGKEVPSGLARPHTRDDYYDDDE